MTLSVERGLVLLATVVVVLSVAATAAAPTDARSDGALTFDAPVPSEYEFTLPKTEGTVEVDGTTYPSVQAAVDAASPGETVVLTGRFDEHVTVHTSNVTLTSAPGTLAVIDGNGTGDVLTLNGDDVTVNRVWVRNSGYDASGNDAAIWVNSTGARIVDSRVTDMTFGIWIDGVNDVLVQNNTIVGREDVRPLSYRGNGVQLWKTERSLIKGNRITDVRDGIYYSWATEVLATDNVMWDLRYGVHYMYSDDSQLVDNLAFNNDVGYALMVSQRLELRDNVAVNNSGQSGHGILVKDIDHTQIRNNSLVANEKGFYVYNSLNNTIADNLVLRNDLGIQLTAGSVKERVYGNSFVYNKRPVLAVTSEQLAWNATDRGNYWSSARAVDQDKDGISEIRHRPAGLTEYLVQEHPQAVVFAHSPAFDAIRLAESSFPVIESPGIVDYHPLSSPAHDWRKYYGNH